MKPSPHRKIDRRQFLKLMGISGLSLLLTRCGLNPLPQASSTLAPALPTATIASAISESSNTPKPTSTPEPTTTPTPAYAAWAAIGRVLTYDLTLVRKELRTMLDGLGGLSDLVRPGARVGIKPNLTGGTWGDSSLPARQLNFLPLTRLWRRDWPNY